MKNGKLAFFNLFSFMSIAALNSQIIPFLVRNEYSLTQKGVVLGSSAILAFIFSILLGHLSDASGKLRNVYLLAAISFSLATCLAFSVSSMGIQMIALIFAFGMVKQTMSINETWSFLSEPAHFGFYHCIAAIGLVIGSLFCGGLANQKPLYIGLFCVLSALFACGICLNLKEVERPTQKITMQTIGKLVNNRAYMVLLGSLFLLMMVGFADQFVVLDKLMQLSENQMLVIIKYAIQSMAEIPFYLSYNYLSKKVPPIRLLVVAALMSIVKFLLYGLAFSASHILFISTLQVVTHPLIVVASKQLIAAVTPKAISSTTQMVGYAIYFGLSGFVTPLLSAWLMPYIGINALLFGFSFLAFLAFLLVLGMKKSGKYDTFNKSEENV